MMNIKKIKEIEKMSLYLYKNHNILIIPHFLDNESLEDFYKRIENKYYELKGK